MWEGRHTTIRSELDLIMDPRVITQDEPLKERTINCPAEREDDEQ